MPAARARNETNQQNICQECHQRNIKIRSVDIQLWRLWVDSSVTLLAVSRLVMLTTHYSLPSTYFSLLTTYYSLLTVYYWLLTTYRLLLITYYSLLTVYRLLLTTECVLLTVYYLLLPIDYYSYLLLFTTATHACTCICGAWCTSSPPPTTCPGWARGCGCGWG